MRRIGLIGGMSWESSANYYKLINRGIHERLGGHHSSELVMVSVDFDPIEKMQRRGAWGEAAASLAEAGAACAAAGAEALLLCTNTMHLVADAVEKGAGIPLLHIADATGEAIVGAGAARVGLLGTRFTMEEPFYRERLEKAFRLETIVPDEASRREVDRVIFEELVHGEIREPSRRRYLEIVEELAADGAEGVILGCTEIGMLIAPGDHRLPFFDTTEIHAQAAVAWSLADGE